MSVPTTDGRATAGLLGSAKMQAFARELAERTAISQGLPARVQDQRVLERVARLAGKESA